MDHPFLTEKELKAVDVELRKLLRALRRSGWSDTLPFQQRVRKVIVAAEGKLVRPGWERAFNDHSWVFTAWFGDLWDRDNRALYNVFTAMIHFVADRCRGAIWPGHLRKTTEALYDALCDHLSCRGFNVPDWTDVPEWFKQPRY